MFDGRIVRAAMLLSALPLAAIADEVVVTDDGREIQLRGDGTWVQLSRDRFATNASGERVRLKPDGTWAIVGAAAQTTLDKTAAVPKLAGAESSLYLAKVEILKRRIKRAKSVHAETNMVYHVQLVNDSPDAIALDRLTGRLKATSSSGGVFPIKAVESESRVVQPGERAQIRITTDGSPQWFGVKHVSLEIAANALGNPTPRVLRKDLDEVERRNVDSL